MYTCAHCGETTYYNWVVCPNCNWSPKIEPGVSMEVNVSVQYEICPLCGGYRWRWQPFDIGSDYNGTDAAKVKPCRCPPEVKKKVNGKVVEEGQPQILVCPNCGKPLKVSLEIEKNERLLHT